jgi:hypothetical protein
MLPDVGGQDAVASAELVEPVEDVLGPQPPLLRVLEGVLLAPARDLLQPGFTVALDHHREQILDRQARVGGHRDVGPDDLVELRGVHVDVDLARAHAELGQLAGDAIVPARADGHDAVAVHDGLVGVGGAVHAEHALVQRVVLGNGALAEQRVHDRRLELLRQSQHRRSRARDHRAVADVQHGLLGLGQQRRDLPQRGGIGLAGGMVTGEIHRLHEVGGARAARDVLGEIDQHRARSSRGGQVERLARDARNVVGVLDQIRVLHHRVGDAGDVRFLEGVLSQHRRDGLAGEHDHRDRVHESGEQPGHRVGGARPRGHEDHAGLAGRPRVAIGHVGRPLLVANQDQLDLRIDQRVEDGHGRPAGEAKDVLHALALQAPNELLGSGRGHRDGAGLDRGRGGGGGRLGHDAGRGLGALGDGQVGASMSRNVSQTRCGHQMLLP